jgi:hypothetical protein
MIRNAERLVPQDGEQWRKLRQRVADGEKVTDALARLDAKLIEGLPRGLALEGETSADCFVECENAIIWIEGKRFAWLSSSIKWDLTRDQLARILEAVWSLAAPKGKDYCLIICHEHPL